MQPMENLKTKMVRNCNRQTEDDLSGPESDGQDNFTYLMCDPDYENDEEEANFVWAYNSAYKDVRKELQARRKDRQFYKPKPAVVKKGKTEGSANFGKGKATLPRPQRLAKVADMATEAHQKS